ncbi:MAG TPA: SpoIIE family protein phosphatase [Burkholderiales bacterium]|nr:SpoIIE family protein phosphatase [Burkholderiales bacterium]
MRYIAAGMNLEPILALAGKLAAPYDLATMLAEVMDAATQVLGAERASVWLYEAQSDELVLRVASDIAPVRLAAGVGIVGTCARTRKLINVPDCYADARFDPSVDKKSGYRTRCLLALPLIDHQGALVGVMQVLNKRGGVFGAADEALGGVLAAQCAVALQRTLMMQQLIEGEKLRREMETARAVQMSTLPAAMPQVPGYDLYGTFQPADLTGGDTFDLALTEQGLLIVLGDATGHGIGPALSVTQMHAMLRMALRLGADLELAYRSVNNQLAERLPADRYITAFIGLLDPATHRLRFHSGGQAPILCYRAKSASFEEYKPTSFPLAAMPLERLRPATTLALGPGDVLALVSDGIYECENARGEQFGAERVRRLIAERHDAPMAELAADLLRAVPAFGTPADDMTLVLVKRELPGARRAFRRSVEALAPIFAFAGEMVMDPALRRTVDLVLEELFTNIVKYGRASETLIDIDIRRLGRGVRVTLIDPDAEYFDPQRAPQPDVSAPLERREPGGLGLHLVRELVDTLEYRYSREERIGRITFSVGGNDADH